MEFSLKGRNFNVVFHKSFAKRWNRLISKNFSLGLLYKNEYTNEWVLDNIESRLRYLINIIFNAIYVEKGLKQALIASNFLETKEKHSDSVVQIIIINLEKANKFLSKQDGHSSKLQGEKWPRIILGACKYADFIVFVDIKGHDDPTYNSQYVKLMTSARKICKDYFDNAHRD